jgi:hypothetical protein
MTDHEPFFDCPVDVRSAPNGDLEFHVTKRDGTVEIIPGPTGMKTVRSYVKATQPARSSFITIEIGPEEAP